MKETIVITTLVENSVPVRGLLAEHGLAFHLQAGPRSLLFDTGQSDLLLHNALKLRISLASPERMEKTIAAFRHLDIQRLAPAHCTGLPALAQLWSAFPGRCAPCAVASTFSFHR